MFYNLFVEKVKMALRYQIIIYFYYKRVIPVYRIIQANILPMIQYNFILHF